jgi:D-alanyl-D-alanine carboxypeptidase
VLGRDGSLATTLVDSPAAGQVFGKTGTRITTTRLAFALMVNNTPLAEFTDILNVFTDQGTMTAALQQGL